MLISCSCTGVLQRGLWIYITVADYIGTLSLQLFSSSIENTKKAELVWCGALGFSSIVHILIFQGLALHNAKPELKPAVTIITLKEIIPEQSASLTYHKRTTPQINLPELTSVTAVAPTSVTSAVNTPALLPSTSPPPPLKLPEDVLQSPDNILPKEMDSYLPGIKVEFDPRVQLQLEPELSIEVELPSMIGADQDKGTQAAKTREKQEVSDNAEAKKTRIVQKRRAQEIIEVDRVGAKKERAVERLKIAKEKLGIAKEREAQLVAKFESEQLDAQEAVDKERLKIIHEIKATEAAEIEMEQLKALKRSTTERLKIIEDRKVKQAEPGRVRLSARQEAKVDRPGIAEEQSQQILRATGKIKITSEEERVLKDIHANYEKLLVAELARHKRYPLSAQRRGHKAVIWVSFKINAAGNLISFKFESPSRFKDLNRAVESMFKRAFPVTPVPKELHSTQKEFWYTLPVEFKN